MSFFNTNKIWGIYSMKNKIVRQLLTMCMVASLAVGTPVITWASDTKTAEQKNTESDTISISEKGAETSIYEDKKVTIKMDSAEYTLDASDIVLNLSIKNMYPNILTLKVQDAKVDDIQTAFKWDSNDYKAGSNCSSCWYIMLEDLQETNDTDFKQLSFTMVGTLNDGTELLKKEIIIAREAFKSVADEDEDEEVSNSESTDSNDITPEATEEVKEEQADVEVKSSDTKSDSDKADSDIEERLSALEENTKELEKKNEELESQYNDLKDENESLKKKNKKLKKQVKELQASQSESNTETTEQEETTPTPEAEEAEVSEEATTPVTEYQDATTIRIVQQALNEAGYNCGTPDGVAGGKTTEAITSYQTAKGITVNGLVTDELLQSLGVVEKVQEAVKAETSKGEYGSGYTYDQLARNPDTYMGQKVKISGKVLQAETSSTTCYARIAMNSSYDTVIFVTYDASLLGYRLLEDDKVTVYGTSYGVYSYEAVSGATITIPWINADIIEM